MFMKFNMQIFAGAIITMIVFSCCVHKPALIEKETCNQNAIDRHVQDCMKNRTANWEVHFKRCNEEAKKEYCKKNKYLIINGEQLDCDSVPEKFRLFCK